MILMDGLMWDALVSEPNDGFLPYSTDSTMRFMGLEVIRTLDSCGIAEILDTPKTLNPNRDMNITTQQTVASMINMQFGERLRNGGSHPTRVLMDHVIWDEIVLENLPHSRPDQNHSDKPRTFMGLEVIRTRDKEGIVEVLP